MTELISRPPDDCYEPSAAADRRSLRH